MGLFDQKTCDICGEKIRLLGNRKLENGNMCSACAKLISSHFSGRRKTTVEDMKEHLAYREQNRAKVAAFRVGQIFGDTEKIYIDAANTSFLVSYNDPKNWEKDNPDVIPISSVTSCYLDTREDRRELFIEDGQGNRKSYNPPRYEYEYDYTMKITVDNPWFQEIDVRLNSSSVDGMNPMRCQQYQTMGDKISSALNAAAATAAAMSSAQKVPEAAPRSDLWLCPQCMQPRSGKFCTECGTPRPVCPKICCEKCGWEVNDSDNIPTFCPNCGSCTWTIR